MTKETRIYDEENSLLNEWCWETIELHEKG